MNSELNRREFIKWVGRGCVGTLLYGATEMLTGMNPVQEIADNAFYVERVSLDRDPNTIKRKLAGAATMVCSLLGLYLNEVERDDYRA